jgi:hypothetical protein
LIDHFFICSASFNRINCFLHSVASVKPEEPVLLPCNAELHIFALQGIAELGVFKVIQHLQALGKPTGEGPCLLGLHPVWAGGVAEIDQQSCEINAHDKRAVLWSLPVLQVSKVA